ncbi:hypothetical protein MIR68_006229 [Amoeboaphelidium protococcarum]|nr:hypothetical protein MIR68_006229 [Amoeboaphelidium protococcarum]
MITRFASKINLGVKKRKRTESGQTTDTRPEGGSLMPDGANTPESTENYPPSLQNDTVTDSLSHKLSSQSKPVNFQELILALVQENAHTAEYQTVLVEHAIPETSLGCGVPAAELQKKYQKVWYVDVRCIRSIAQEKKATNQYRAARIRFDQLAIQNITLVVCARSVIDPTFQQAALQTFLVQVRIVFYTTTFLETENSWQARLVWKSGVRLQSRVWHSVTEENLEDLDILRDAKPEKLSRESVARGKMTKEIPTVIDSDIYYRSAKVEFPVMQVDNARAVNHYAERYRAGKSSKRWASLWRLVQELVRPKKRK